MIVFDHRIIGIAILCLLGLLIAVKRAASGSILDRPKGNLLVQIVNIYNLFFLLVVNPLAAILMIVQRIPALDSALNSNLWIYALTEITGMIIYVSGCLLMASALVSLGNNYQLGGSAPRTDDRMVVAGPYRLVRHPMYSAALSISLGLACLLHWWPLFCVFAIYLVLVLFLIPAEENELHKAYGEQYSIYQRQTRGLIPFVY